MQRDLDVPQVVLPVGGKGTRLAPLTDELPKCLVPINGKPFIEYVIENFVQQGIVDIVLCSGHYAAAVTAAIGDGSRWNISVRHSVEDKPLGPIGALRHASAMLRNVFIFSYGDAYLTFPLCHLKDRYIHGAQPAVMTVTEVANGNVLVRDGLVADYNKTDNKGYDRLDYGLLLIEKRLLAAGTEFDENSFYSRIARSGQLAALECPPGHRPYEIGSHGGYRDFCSAVRKGTVP